MLTQAPKGTYDVVPRDSAAWQWVETIEREICALHDFHEMRTPVFEHTELFQRGVGDTTDIVQKEMYTFDDKGGRSLTLKPEGTAGAVRAFIEHGLFNEALPAKIYYINNPIFRYESPQSGRMREHHQFGVELFGAPLPQADAQVISIGMQVVQRIGLDNLSLRINSIGCPECRPAYQHRLRDHFRPNFSKLCPDCQSRFERNPLRLLDCKVEGCQPFKQGAPTTLECLCEACAEHFEGLKQSLSAINLAYVVDPNIVRGLDYYTRTVFEIISPLPDGGELTACGGGRYDVLVETLGGPPTAAMGFGMGTERVLMALRQQEAALPSPSIPAVYLASLGEECRLQAFALAESLRNAGVSAASDLVGRSMKAQFKYAGKLGVPFVAVLAPDELEKGVVQLRDMRTSEEREIPLEDLAEALDRERA